VIEKIDPTWQSSDGARAAVPDLLKALEDPHSDVRKAAAEALEKIDPDALKRART